MKPDTYQKIEKDFGDDIAPALDRFQALEAETKGMVDDRLVRAIIYLAKGDIGALDRYIVMAKLDWRDVLVNAEYRHPGDKKLRDFTLTFHQLGLL